MAIRNKCIIFVENNLSKMNIEDYKKRIAYGEPFMKTLSNISIHYIEWRETEARFVAVYDYINKWHIDLTCGLHQKWIDEYGKEIIGNIYDNPEILNK